MRLAICIYKLTRGDYNYNIAEIAGVAESTVCQIIIDVCKAIAEKLWEESVESHFPESKEEFQEFMITMGSEWQFPYAFCAIDGSHLPIKCPDGGAESMKQYFNFKNFYSIVLLALFDARYRFIWASIGAPGNTHDSTYFQSTDLWKGISEGDFIPEETCVLNNVNIPPMVLGDGAFPLKT